MKLGPYVESEVADISKVVATVQVLVSERTLLLRLAALAVRSTVVSAAWTGQEENKEHRFQVCEKIIDMMKLGVKRCAKLTTTQPLLLLGQVPILLGQRFRSRSTFVGSGCVVAHVRMCRWQGYQKVMVDFAALLVRCDLAHVASISFWLHSLIACDTIAAAGCLAAMHRGKRASSSTTTSGSPAW